MQRKEVYFSMRSCWHLLHVLQMQLYVQNHLEIYILFYQFLDLVGIRGVLSMLVQIVSNYAIKKLAKGRSWMRCYSVNGTSSPTLRC